MHFKIIGLHLIIETGRKEKINIKKVLSEFLV